MNEIATAFENVVKRSEQNIPIEQGDYIGNDGLIYCHKCNTPKQCRVENPFTHNIDIRRCICKCRQEEIKAEEAEQKRQEFLRTVREYRRIGFPDDELRNCTFANDDLSNEKLTNAMKNYVDNFNEFKQQGKGLLFYGEVDTGKTFAAACVANALIDKGYPCLVTNFARIANTIQGTFEKQDYYDSLNRFALLVIDDLSAERKTDYMQEIIYNVIDNRYRAGLPLIITTNLTSKELKHPADVVNQRIFSRVLEICHPIKVEGKHRRREKLKAEFNSMNDKLGL